MTSGGDWGSLGDKYELYSQVSTPSSALFRLVNVSELNESLQILPDKWILAIGTRIQWVAFQRRFHPLNVNKQSVPQLRIEKSLLLVSEYGLYFAGKDLSSVLDLDENNLSIHVWTPGV
jgi:hypothetical protein